MASLHWSFGSGRVEVPEVVQDDLRFSRSHDRKKRDRSATAAGQANDSVYHDQRILGNVCVEIRIQVA